jgi:hypothetical protein
MNWTAWQAAGFDTHGLNADPQLVDVTQTDRDWNDYVLQSDSPCIGVATSISSGTYYYYDVAETHRIHTMTGITCDYNSYSRASDLGALEYGAGPGPSGGNFVLTSVSIKNMVFRSR